MKKNINVKNGCVSVLKLLREFLALIIWGSMFVEIFVADIGDYAISLHSSLSFIFEYRLLFILSTISLAWLMLGNKLFAQTFGYIVAYPLVVIIWKLPKLFLRNWAVAIAFLPAMHEFISTFKINFIIGVSIIVTAFIVCLAPNDSLFIPIGMVILGGHLIMHFYKKFSSAYSSKTIFTVIRENIASTIETFRGHIEKKTPEGDHESEEYKKQLGESLLQTYMFTTGLHISIGKVKEVINSRKMDLYFLSSLIWTFALSAISFGILYFGLYQIDSNNFNNAHDANLWDFIGFSFSTLMTSSISTISPASGTAQIFTYIQLFVSLLLVVLLVFIILTSIREKYKKDLDDLLAELEDAHEKSSYYVESNFELTAEALESRLIRNNEQIMELMLGAKYGKTQAKSIMDKFKENDIEEAEIIPSKE